MNQDDLNRLNTLLEHSSEFIDYFDLVERKMIDWQQQIEQYLERLEHTMSAQAYETQLSLIISEIKKNQAHEHQILTKLKQDVIRTTKISVEHIQNHSEKLLEHLDKRFKEYDPSQFQRIANESLDHVERVAQDAVYKSNRLLKFFTWRIGFVAVICSLFTTIIMGLYISDEWPWETHRQAMSERGAGRMLIQAWPHLSHQQQLEILKHEPVTHG